MNNPISFNEYKAAIIKGPEAVEKLKFIPKIEPYPDDEFVKTQEAATQNNESSFSDKNNDSQEALNDNKTINNNKIKRNAIMAGIAFAGGLALFALSKKKKIPENIPTPIIPIIPPKPTPINPSGNRANKGFDMSFLLDGFKSLTDIDNYITKETSSINLDKHFSGTPKKEDIVDAILTLSGITPGSSYATRYLQGYHLDKHAQAITQNNKAMEALNCFLGELDSAGYYSYSHENLNALEILSKNITNDKELDSFLTLLKLNKASGQRATASLLNNPKGAVRLMAIENILNSQSNKRIRLSGIDNKKTEEIFNILKLFRNGNLDKSTRSGIDEFLNLPNLSYDKVKKFIGSLNDNSLKCITFDDFPIIFKNPYFKDTSKLAAHLNNLDDGLLAKIQNTSLKTYLTFFDFINIKDIDEIPLAKKQALINSLVTKGSLASKQEKELCSILPSTKDEYCTLLQKLAKSIGITTKSLTDSEKIELDKCLSDLTTKIRNINIENGFLKLQITREDFVKTIQKQLSSFTEKDRAKITNHLGFSIINGKLTGYPIPQDDAYISQITQPEIQKAVKKINGTVSDFCSSSKNPITINSTNADVQKDIETIFRLMPELKPMVAKMQHGTHVYTLDIHTLKVFQQVCSNPEFDKLSESDKKVLSIASLLHDITKAEGTIDKMHPINSAFDAFYIIDKLDLTHEQKSKIYELIKTHNWLELMNKAHSKGNQNCIELAQDFAFETRHGNTFELAKILCQADMKSVNPGFYGRFSSTFTTMSEEIDKYLTQIKSSKIILPTAKIPKASQMKNLQAMKADGVENKVLFMHSANNDLSQYGFEKGTTKDDFFAIVHTLKNEENLSKLQTFGAVDNDVLLSTSYIDSNNFITYQTTSGLMLDVDADDIHAGYYHNFASGKNKSIELLKQDYLFYGDRVTTNNVNPGIGYSRRNRSDYRAYISDILKQALGITEDKKYIETIENIQACESFAAIKEKDPELANTIATALRNDITGSSRHNEILVSRPKIKAIFSREKNYENIPLFLRKFAQDNDLPVIIFS